MSGDVQPRKRKDKKRKKDDLGVEEPRGTAAVFGEGDVFIHSPHDHGTGGHWCAKIIFFSLLAVLVTLIGMIILENRGLSELEANSVESRYSGVLDGWLEDSHDDDHHDVHTLELKHHDDENNHNDISDELDHDEADDDHDDDGGGDNDDNEELNESKAEDDDDDEEESDADDEDDSLELHEKVKDQEVDNDDDEEESDTGDDDDDDNSLELREKAKDQEEEDYNEDELSQENDDDDDEDNYDENEQKNDQDEQKSVEEADEDDQFKYKKYYESYKAARDEDNDDDDKNDDLRKLDEFEDSEDESIEKNLSSDDLNDEEDDEFKSDEIEDNDDDKDIIDNDDSINDRDAEEVEKDEDKYENNDTEEEDEDHDVKEEENIEVEKIEREFSEEDEEEPPESDEVLPQVESSDADLSKEEEVSNEFEPDDIDEDDVELLEPDDDVPEIVERITAPPGKPLVEVEEEATSEKPPDTLAEEEEYEKQQEELRRQKEEGSHVWLKVVVGGALLVATHAVVRRATAPRDSPVTQERVAREDTPITDRRMTLIAEETPLPAVQRPVPQEPSSEIITMEKTKSVTVVQSAPEPEVESEEEIEVGVDDEDIKQIPTTEEESNAVKEKDFEDNELYSDEDVEEEEIVDEKEEVPKVVDSIQSVLKEKTPEPDDLSEDVEIIDDEQLDDEIEEEVEDEEEISDVDDAELLSRLEAKYGKLPAPERAGRNPKDGGESLEDDWPGEPSDPYWRRQLDQAEKDFQKGEWSSAVDRAGAEQLRASGRARWLSARALDALAEAKRDNRLLTHAIAAYLDLLKMNERLSDKKLLDVTSRTLNRIQFRGNYLSAEPVYRLLIRRFPNDVNYRNNLTVSFLMANRADLAEDVLKETLKMWPNDRVALAHLGFVLKTQHNRLEEAVDAFQKALDGDTGPATEPRFYYHLGDSLLLLGRYKEAQEVHKRGAAFGHFLSPSQRSLYNVDRLKSRPWWKVDETPYVKLARDLEKSWKDILKEGEAAWALYEKEKEGLKERGEWSQLDLFVRGREVPDRCKRAPVTCTIVKSEPSASGCRRGQVKFSAMAAGTHVRPHVGPTNCRLRMHLGLSNTKDTYLRVDQETRQWQTGKVLLFDDSFEHEVWHNGTGTRLVLIVDVWHPDLTPSERRQLPAI